MDFDEAFGHWLAGFIDGEGCFAIERHHGHWHAFRFYIRLRADDLPVLEEIQERLGIGTISGPAGHGNPDYRYQIASETDCRKLIEVLDRCPLRAKKRRDYETWREGVLLTKVRRFERGRWFERRHTSEVERLKAELQEGRRFVNPIQEIAA